MKIAQPAVRLFLAVVLCLSCSCRQKKTEDAPVAKWESFDRQSAFETIENLINFGSRSHGSPGNRHAAHYLMARLNAYNLSPALQTFTNETPDGLKEFRNIEAIIPGASTGLVLITTHYDGKQDPSPDFPSANSAGSGPAVLLEIARVLKQGYNGRGPEIRLIFFDGQEPLSLHYTAGDGLRGSTYYARRLMEQKRNDEVLAVINLDMVGDRDLTITIPDNVSAKLRAQLLAVAREENARSYFRLYSAEIGDDHDPFHQLHMPALDIIDYEYGSSPGRNDYWRTGQDTLDKISPESLDIIGRVTLRLIRDLVSPREGVPL